MDITWIPQRPSVLRDPQIATTHRLSRQRLIASMVTLCTVNIHASFALRSTVRCVTLRKRRLARPAIPDTGRTQRPIYAATVHALTIARLAQALARARHALMGIGKTQLRTHAAGLARAIV